MSTVFFSLCINEGQKRSCEGWGIWNPEFVSLWWRCQPRYTHKYPSETSKHTTLKWANMLQMNWERWSFMMQKCTLFSNWLLEIFLFLQTGILLFALNFKANDHNGNQESSLLSYYFQWKKIDLRCQYKILIQFSSIQFSLSVVSNSLRPHESRHARPPCPSPTPRVHSDSCSSSQWCHSAI